MKRLSTLVLAIFTLTACGQSAASFRNGVPTPDNAKLVLAGDTGQPLTDPGIGQGSQPLQGAQSNFYVLTRDVTRFVNGGVAVTLGLVRTIVAFKPTTISAGTATWGPVTPDLAPNTWKLSVTKNSDGSFSYELDGKPKGTTDDQYQTVLSGTHVVATDASGKAMPGYGSGTFLLDFDARNKLRNPNAKVTGSAQVTYSRMSPTSDVTIAVDFANMTDARSGRVFNAHYAYTHTANVGGTFQFAADSDVDGDGTLEDLSIESRWQSSGAGRSDIRATGGDLAQPATVNECWDDMFMSTYMAVSFSSDAAHNYGDEATGCVFPSAEYSSLN